MKWLSDLLSTIIGPIRLTMTVPEIQTIQNVALSMGIVVEDNVYTEMLTPGVHLFYGFDRASGRMLRYKAIELGTRLKIERH